MHTPPMPWIITLSLRFYHWLLRVGPTTYRTEYEEPTLQVFRQCCRDAYRQRGTWGVMLLWLPMFSEAIFGMLAEHFFVLRHIYERVGQMLATMRRSMISTLCAFIFFGVAYIFLMRITDPRAPLDEAASGHPVIGLSFAIINWSAEIAFLVVVIGGLPILFSAFRHALAEKHGLTPFTIRPKQLFLLLGATVALEIAFFAFLIIVQFLSGAPASQHPVTPLPPIQIVEQLSIITLFTFVILAIPLFIGQAILRTEFSERMLRYALIIMGIATLAMGIACIATTTWIVSFWIAAPEIAASQGLGLAGLRGNIGGSEGVVIVVVMMALAAIVSTFAIKGGMQTRTFATV